MQFILWVADFCICIDFIDTAVLSNKFNNPIKQRILFPKYIPSHALYIANIQYNVNQVPT